MKTKAEFESFWNKNLDSGIEQLHQSATIVRKKYSFKLYGRKVLILFFANIFYIFINPYLPTSISEGIGVILFALMFLYIIVRPIVILLKRNSMLRPLEEVYIEKFQPQIVKFIDSSLKFKSGTTFSLEEFNKASMFVGAENMKPTFLITGIFGGNILGISNVFATYQEARRNTNSTSNFSSSNSSSTHFSTSNSSGTHRVSTTLYDGLFAITRTKETISSELMIRHTDFDRRYLSADSNETVSVNTEFDKHFVCSESNEMDLKKFLTTTLQTRLVEFYKTTQIPFCLKIIKNELYVAIQTPPGFFIWTMGYHFSENKNNFLFFDYINTAINLIEIVIPADSNPSETITNDSP